MNCDKQWKINQKEKLQWLKIFCQQSFFLYAANYLDNWKCISVLKGDGTTVDGAVISSSSNAAYAGITGASNGTLFGGTVTTPRYPRGTPVTGASSVGH